LSTRLPLRWRARRLSRWLRSCDGVAAVEAALVLPVFLAFVFGIIEVSRAYRIQTALQFAVEDAARCAAINRSTCGSIDAIQNYAASKAPGLTIPPRRFNVTLQRCGIEVAIDYPFTSLVGNLVPLSATLSAQSCHA